MMPPTAEHAEWLLKMLGAKGIIIIAFGDDGTRASFDGVDDVYRNAVGNIMDAIIDGLEGKPQAVAARRAVA